MTLNKKEFMVVPSLGFGATHKVNNITSQTQQVFCKDCKEMKKRQNEGNLDPAGMRGIGQREQGNTVQRCLTAQQTGTVQTEAIIIGFVMGHVGSIGSTRRAGDLHQPVARESLQRQCCYRGPSL
jgi:hypothetical protein